MIKLSWKVDSIMSETILIKQTFDAFFLEYKEGMKTFDKINNNPNNFRTQVLLYSAKQLKDCKSVSDLIKVKRAIITTYNNFYNSYLELNSKLNNVSDPVERAKIQSKIKECKVKIIALKESLGRVEALITKCNSLGMQNNNLYSLHSNVYKLKVLLSKTNPNNEKEYNTVLNNLIKAQEAREECIASLTFKEDAAYLLSDVRSREDMCIRLQGKEQVKPYTLSKDKYMSILQNLNVEIGENKFNSEKYVAHYTSLLGNDPNALKKYYAYLESLQDRRRDIIFSVLGKDGCKVLDELSGYERVYPHNDDFKSFMAKGGKITGKDRDRRVYNTGRAAYLADEDKLSKMMHQAFENKDSYQVTPHGISYEDALKLRDKAYESLDSEIEYYNKEKSRSV